MIRNSLWIVKLDRSATGCTCHFMTPWYVISPWNPSISPVDPHEISPCQVGWYLQIPVYPHEISMFFFGFVQSVILEQIQGERVQSNPMDMDWYGEHMGTPTLWNGDLQWIYPAIKFGGSFQFVFWGLFTIEGTMWCPSSESLSEFRKVQCHYGLWYL
jgi:hypothetical protein